MMARTLVLFAALGVAAGATVDPVASPVGETVVVVEKDLSGFAIADSLWGGYHVVWTEQDGGIKAQQRGYDGRVQGPVVVVKEANASFSVSEPCIVEVGMGGFAVAWAQTQSEDFVDWQISARVFNIWGKPRTNEFVVSANKEGLDEQQPVCTRVEGGLKFAVTWSSQTSSSDKYFDLFGKVYTFRGEQAGEQFALNARTSGWQDSHSTVSTGRNGGFAAVWRSTERNLEGVYIRTFSSTGAPLAEEEVLVSEPGRNDLEKPSIGKINGGYAVAWADYAEYSNTHIDVRTVDRDLKFTSNVTTTVTGVTQYVDQFQITRLGHRQSLLVYGAYAEDSSVKSLVLDADLAPIGSPYTVDTNTTGFQLFPKVATIHAHGRVVVAYMDDPTSNFESFRLVAQTLDMNAAR